MVGSVDAVSSGHSVKVDFLENQILLRFPDYRTASKLQKKMSLEKLAAASRALNLLNQRVLAKIGRRREIEIFPQPSWIVRILSPAIGRFADAANVEG